MSELTERDIEFLEQLRFRDFDELKQRVDAVESKIEDLTSLLDQVEKELAEFQARIAALGGPCSG